MIRKIKIKGLDSLTEAKEIEHKVKELEGIEKAYYNLTKSELLVDFRNSATAHDEYQKIKHIIKMVNPDVRISCSGLKPKHLIGFLNGYIFYIIGVILFFVEFLFLDSFYLMVFSFILVANMAIRKSIYAFINGVALDENTLMVIATVAAIYTKSYLEAVLVISFYTVGEFLQQSALRHTEKEIQSLLDMKITAISVIRGSSVELVEVGDLVANDIILIKRGETIPVDGVILSGSTYLDTRYVTGRGKPVPVTTGNEVLGGVINIDKPIEVKVSRPYRESRISKLVDLIKESTWEKNGSQKTLTRFAKYYTPLVILAAVLVFFIPVYVMKQDMQDSLVRACDFLLISCPCALVLSIPMAYFAALRKSEKYGILFKGCNHIDAINQVDNIFIDKTETIITDHMCVTHSSSEEALKLAASIERFSKHPIAKAIVGDRKEFYEVTDFTKIPNRGLRGFVNGQELIVGNRFLMHEFEVRIDITDLKTTRIYVALDKQLVGTIDLDDVIKQESIDAFKYFKDHKINVTFLSNDNMAKAQHLATELGAIYRQGLLPGDKIIAIDEVGEDAFTMFIGDGENDAPALMNADLGVATGSFSSPLSLEVSDIIVLDDDISIIKRMFMIARKTKFIVLFNLLISFAIKFVFLGFAAFGDTTVLWALLADICLAVAATFNSLRILK